MKGYFLIMGRKDSRPVDFSKVRPFPWPSISNLPWSQALNAMIVKFNHQAKLYQGDKCQL
jgi:hypothetical protein